jgi:signal peptidase I
MTVSSRARTTDPAVEARGPAATRGRGRVLPPVGMRWVAAALVLVAVVLTLRVFVLGWYPARSHSMAPTINRGDRVLVDKVGWRLGGLGRGDLIVFTSPVDGERLVKRVVAVGGDTVAIDDAFLVINGRRVSEPYVDHSRIDGTYFGTFTVPPGHLFVLGDNRFGSIDSRVFGPIPVDAVTGRLLGVLG